MWANTPIMIVSFSFWDEMMKNMIIIDNNLSEQIIIRLFTQSNEGFTWMWAVSKTFLMKAWILFIVWDVVSMPEFLWLRANPHQVWDAYMSLLRTLERKYSCSSSTCMACSNGFDMVRDSAHQRGYIFNSRVNEKVTLCILTAMFKLIFHEEWRINLNMSRRHPHMKCLHMFRRNWLNCHCLCIYQCMGQNNCYTSGFNLIKLLRYFEGEDNFIDVRVELSNVETRSHATKANPVSYRRSHRMKPNPRGIHTTNVRSAIVRPYHMIYSS